MFLVPSPIDPTRRFFGVRSMLRDFGIVLSVLSLATGVYLLHDAFSGVGYSGPASLIIGSVLCALSLIAGLASIRLQYSLRALKNYVLGKRNQH